jgi:hypothetical protein
VSGLVFLNRDRTFNQTAWNGEIENATLSDLSPCRKDHRELEWDAWSVSWFHVMPSFSIHREPDLTATYGRISTLLISVPQVVQI